MQTMGVFVAILLGLLGLAQGQNVAPYFDSIDDQYSQANGVSQSVQITGIQTGTSVSAYFQQVTVQPSGVNSFVTGYVFGASSATLTYTVPTNSNLVGSTFSLTVTLQGTSASGQILTYSRVVKLYVTSPPVNCAYSRWSEWSQCDKSCGTGAQSHSRTITQYPTGNGTPCTEPLTESRSCNSQSCLPPTIDPIPDQTVNQDGGSFEIQMTGITPGYNEYDQTITISATSNNPSVVPDPLVIYEGSPRPSTRGMLMYSSNPGQFGEAMITVTLTDSGSSNPGASQGSYTTVDTFRVTVKANPVDCRWVWNEWQPCTKTCGVGETTRTIRILEDSQYGGESCPTQRTEAKQCNDRECPVDCKMGWNEWQECSRTCGSDGTQDRYEYIMVPASNGGARCQTPRKESRPCVGMKACPIDCATAWGSWSSCSKTCGGGVNTRQMYVTRQAQHGGDACPNPLPKQEKPCNTNNCANCQVTPWSEWTTCDSNCFHERSRDVVGDVSGTDCNMRESEACTGGMCMPGRGECFGHCGLQAPRGCYCDGTCEKWGDCCPNYESDCNIKSNVHECQGSCGYQAVSGCWCDKECELTGDCCQDYYEHCTYQSQNTCVGRCGMVNRPSNMAPYGQQPGGFYRSSNSTENDAAESAEGASGYGLSRAEILSSLGRDEDGDEDGGSRRRLLQWGSPPPNNYGGGGGGYIGSFPPNGNGGYPPNGNGPPPNSCSCDVNCYKFNDCCPDFNQACPHFNQPPPPNFNQPPMPSCVGICGTSNPVYPPPGYNSPPPMNYNGAWMGSSISSFPSSSVPSFNSNSFGPAWGAPVGSNPGSASMTQATAERISIDPATGEEITTNVHYDQINMPTSNFNPNSNWANYPGLSTVPSSMSSGFPHSTFNGMHSSALGSSSGFPSSTSTSSFAPSYTGSWGASSVSSAPFPTSSGSLYSSGGFSTGANYPSSFSSSSFSSFPTSSSSLSSFPSSSAASHSGAHDGHDHGRRLLQSGLDSLFSQPKFQEEAESQSTATDKQFPGPSQPTYVGGIYSGGGGGSFPPPPNYGSSGKPCFCDHNCHVTQDCCPDYHMVCENVGNPFFRTFEEKDPSSCKGRCMESAENGHDFDCFCDDTCVLSGDCCMDKVKECL